MTDTPRRHYCGRCGAELKTMGCPNECYSLRADTQEEAVQKVRDYLDGKVTPNIEWVHRNRASILFARIDSLEAENAQLREALERIAHLDPFEGPSGHPSQADIARQALEAP